MRRIAGRKHRAGRFADDWFNRTYGAWRRRLRWGTRLAAWLEGQPETVSAQSVENARSCLRRLEADAVRDAA